jgi:hypothetical protein
MANFYLLSDFCFFFRESARATFRWPSTGGCPSFRVLANVFVMSRLLSTFLATRPGGGMSRRAK